MCLYQSVKMKYSLSFIIALFFSTCGFSQGIEGFEPYYITGYKVNVRKESGLDAKVRFQANWGDKFMAIKINENWTKVLSWDESKYYYVHSDYIKPKDEFFQAALHLEQRNPKTDILLIDHFLDQNKLQEATDIAIKWINKTPSETIYLGFEKCEQVSHLAYFTIANSDLDSLSQDYVNQRLISEAKNLTILNLIELRLIEELIRKREYPRANDWLFHLLRNRAGNLYIKIACEYDYESKIYPQIWFKNLFFISYHLSSAEEQSEIRNNLKEIRDDESLSEQSRNMADDIFSKVILSIWKID